MPRKKVSKVPPKQNSVRPDRPVSIPGEAYNFFCERTRKLTALEACGVDKWDGYEKAMKLLKTGDVRW